MYEIFISYRREDSQDATGRIHDRLEMYFGPDAIFRDVGSVQSGAHFPDRLDEAIRSCKIVLAIIGPTWTKVTDERRSPRGIFDERDWVRIELAKAFEWKIKVLPVLVTNARMPRSDEVPSDLQALPPIGAVTVEPGIRFESDIKELLARVEELSGISGDNYRQLLQECRDLGLTSASVGVLSTDPLVDDMIHNAQDLIGIMNDGRGFLDSKQEDIRSRTRDDEKTTRFVFLHPQSEYLHSLIKKNLKTHAEQVGDIRRGFRALTQTSYRKSSISIRGSFGILPSSYLISERYALVSPYLSAERGSLPIFRFASGKDDKRRFYDLIVDDAEKVFAAAKDLSASDFPS
jgi:hypothetical protein